MTDGVTELVCTESLEPVHLQSPYGDVSAQLCLRNSPRFGRDAYVSLLGDGQFICRSYDGCSVMVRFDSAAPARMSATDASDGSSNIIFFTGRARLERGLTGTSRTLIAAEFY